MLFSIVVLNILFVSVSSHTFAYWYLYKNLNSFNTDIGHESPWITPKVSPGAGKNKQIANVDYRTIALHSHDWLACRMVGYCRFLSSISNRDTCPSSISIGPQCQWKYQPISNYYGKGKVKSPVVNSALSQLCDLSARCSSPFTGLEPAVSCKHSSVIWVVGHTSPIYCRYLFSS